MAVSDPELVITVYKDKPRFDFSNLSWGDAKSVTRAQGQIKRATREGDDEALETGFAAMQAHLAKCVVYIPADWVVGGEERAAGLDWSKPESFDALKSQRMGDLLKELADAQRSENASGN